MFLRSTTYIVIYLAASNHQPHISVLSVVKGLRTQFSRIDLVMTYGIFCFVLPILECYLMYYNICIRIHIEHTSLCSFYDILKIQSVVNPESQNKGGGRQKEIMFSNFIRTHICAC